MYPSSTKWCSVVQTEREAEPLRLDSQADRLVVGTRPVGLAGPELRAEKSEAKAHGRKIGRRRRDLHGAFAVDGAGWAHTPKSRDEMAGTDLLREQLIGALDGSDAHLAFDAAVRDFPAGAINGRAPNVPYTPWHLLEHIRTAQRDILDYIRDRAYLAPAWPDEYWPARDAVATPAEFDRTVEATARPRGAPRDRRRPRPRPAGTDPGHPGSHDPARGPDRGGARCLPRRGVRDPPPGHGRWPPGRDEDA